jgi:hypothetical protein
LKYFLLLLTLFSLSQEQVGYSFLAHNKNIGAFTSTTKHFSKEIIPRSDLNNS